MEPDNRIWYAVWNMEIKKNVPGTIVKRFLLQGSWKRWRSGNRIWIKERI